MKPILEVSDLHVTFRSEHHEVKAIRGVDFTIHEGEVVAFVGESGSGKSVTFQSIMRLLPQPPANIDKGTILYNGRDITKISETEMQKIRGKEIAMIFQDPMTSLNPTIRVGKQIAESLMKHQKVTYQEAKDRAVELLKMVGIPSPSERVNQYPHQFSGGMRQRAMIAMALACSPKLLIADEPTTALDVTIQAQIIDLLKDLQTDTGSSIVFITHDLGVVAEIADRVAVMYAGKIVETGTLDEIFYNPRHPYTWGLLASMPRLDQTRDQDLASIPGSPPSLVNPPVGCPFTARCPYAMKICQEQMPETTKASDSHQVACWLQHPDSPKVENPIVSRR
ncbi:ABC transporter ATP-binding protein [Shimazuella sp. AN120528]|uniref:ABC transporter ATP-binding protein n=1 Tax=Shimazuella soli TaxID=1892854 RepID=UPI001F116A4C|nr:ABC transporter ATP-binding protein [Shimazuella soli]MCH5584626.1 ABC transporter ATP-binding protein [Shimazuella soli]